jgi:hypothetical protein
MVYIPHEKLSINWNHNNEGFQLSLPWLSMDIDVEKQDKDWIKEATHYLHLEPANQNVQKFIEQLKDYPIFYIQPRKIEDFQTKTLQPCPKINIDCSSPKTLIETLGCKLEDDLKGDVLSNWTWDQEKILEKAHITGTDLYDPVSLVTYLICYRLEWESTTWSGQDGFGQFLEELLKQDEQKFFRTIGWISKQSWYVTMESCHSMEPALTSFPVGKELVNHFIHDEVGHYKFMEQVFGDLDLNKDDFPVAAGTKWLLEAHKRVASLSPLAFSAMINLFEAAYYEGQDPISRVIKLSSKPHAARGYDLHYKINQEHRHCDMPVLLSRHLAPQTRSHAELTLGLFEQTLYFLDQLEIKLAENFKI